MSVDRRRDSFNSLLSDHHLSLSRTGEEGEDEEHPQTEARVGELINYYYFYRVLRLGRIGING